jgi:hypothetical protein
METNLRGADFLDFSQNLKGNYELACLDNETVVVMSVVLVLTKGEIILSSCSGLGIAGVDLFAKTLEMSARLLREDYSL